MDSIKEEINDELKNIRINKNHVYNTILKLMDVISQKAPEPSETPEPVETPAKKSTGRKRKVVIKEE